MSKELLRIAFADDDQDDHLFFFSAVREIYSLSLISNFFASQELHDFYRKDKNISPHIFFIDMNMPGNERFQCLDEIKHDSALSHVPVIIYSTSASESDIQMSLSKGAAAFITKPSEIETTIRVLRETIEQYAGIKFREKAGKNA